MSRAHHPQSVSLSSAQWLRNHRYELEDLPEPGVEWRLADINISVGNFRQLVHDGLIESAGRVDGKDTRVWKTDPLAYKSLQEYLARDADTDSTLPCGHNGFVNLRGTPHVLCKIEQCDDRIHHRSEVRR